MLKWTGIVLGVWTLAGVLWVLLFNALGFRFQPRRGMHPPRLPGRFLPRGMLLPARWRRRTDSIGDRIAARRRSAEGPESSSNP